MKRVIQGLSLFIADIRKCKCKEDEVKRINKELANIRSKFKSNKPLNGYDKRKYVCKLVFIFLLGHDFDLGHIEAVNLLNSNKFSEKHTGYLFLSVVLKPKSDLMFLVTKAIESDLTSFNIEHQNLALKYVANAENMEIAKAASSHVLSLVLSNDTMDHVRQSAILCLLRLFRLKHGIFRSDLYSNRIATFLTDENLGVASAAASFIDALAASSQLNGEYFLPLAIFKLNRVVNYSAAELPDYNYYSVLAPWLCVKLLRLLQKCPIPTENPFKSRLIKSIEIIFNSAQEPPKTKKIEHRNCRNAIMLEAIHLVYHLNTEPTLQIRACNILDLCLKQNDNNLRYLALEKMQLLSKSEFCRNRFKQQLNSVLDFLDHETDICIRQKVIAFLYILCDKHNVNEIIEEMRNHLETVDEIMKVEVALKISILAERYFSDRRCYIDVVLHVLKVSGECISEEVWYRFVQLVLNDATVHDYAAKCVFEALQDQICNENLVKVAGYILGEFGNLIAGDEKSSPKVQLRLLHSKFPQCSRSTKALLLTTYVKFFNLFPCTKTDVKNILCHNALNSDPEIQQRSVEYLQLCNRFSRDGLALVLEEMPYFKDRVSPVEVALQKLRNCSLEQNFVKESKASGYMPLSRSTSSKETLNDSTLEQVLADIMSPRTTHTSQNEYMPLEEFNLHKEECNLHKEECNSPKRLNEQDLGPLFRKSNDEALHNLIWQKSGLLFENNLIEIQCLGEFRGHKGKLRLKYKNKAPQIFHNFQTDFPSVEVRGKLKFQTSPCSTFITPSHEISQDFTVECIDDFNQEPSMSLSFACGGVSQAISLRLPMTLNKFIEPVPMEPNEFFMRWRNMSKPYQEQSNIFPARTNMGRYWVMNKLKGLGFELLNIDTNPTDFVGAGIFYSEVSQVGILFRLQSKQQENLYRLTVRSLKDSVSEEISKLIQILL